MFKYIAFFFAVLAVAFAVPKPGYLAAPVAYTAGYAAPAYAGYAAAPVAAAYASPYAYSGYGAYSGAYSAYPYAYAY